VRGIDLRATPRAERIVGVVETHIHTQKHTHTRKHARTQLSSCVERQTSCSIEFKRQAPDGRTIHHVHAPLQLHRNSTTSALRRIEYPKIALFSSHHNLVRSFFYDSTALVPKPSHCQVITIKTKHTRQDSYGRVIGPSQRRLYLKHNNLRTQTSMLPAGFELSFPTSDRSQTHALVRVATGKICSPYSGLKKPSCTISFLLLLYSFVCDQITDKHISTQPYAYRDVFFCLTVPLDGQ